MSDRALLIAFSFGLAFMGIAGADKIALADSAVVSPDCTAQGKRLFGKVQIVSSFPDLKVQKVESFPDLKVQVVESFPDRCGKWQMVESFPDLKIQFVDSFPDVKIQYVTSFPGRP